MSNEAKYAQTVNSRGRYTYITGYKEKKVKVIHNKCGNEIELSITGALIVAKKDVCVYCKKTNKNNYYKRKEKRVYTELESFCRREVKRLMEVMFVDGYLFESELREYVRLAVINYEYGLTKYSEEDLINTYIKLINERYKKQKIGKCTKCETVYRGSDAWGGESNFIRKVCGKCTKNNK